MSDWFLKQKDCPNCRVKALEVKMNPIVNSLIENYIEIHPELKRSAEDHEA